MMASDSPIGAVISVRAPITTASVKSRLLKDACSRMNQLAHGNSAAAAGDSRPAAPANGDGIIDTESMLADPSLTQVIRSLEIVSTNQSADGAASSVALHGANGTVGASGASAGSGGQKGGDVDVMDAPVVVRS